MSRTSNLFRLQTIDTQLQRTHARMAEIEASLADDAEVRASEARLEAATQAFESAESDLRSTENATRDQRLKIEQSENHLYSGKITNPKELQDQQKEVAALKRYLDVLEERQIEAMLAAEQAQAALEDAKTDHANLQARKIEQDAGLQGEMSTLAGEVRRLETERAAALRSISAEDLALYEKLRSQRSGVAVAGVQNRSCSACGSSLSSSLYQAARSPADLALCDSCGRILYAGN